MSGEERRLMAVGRLFERMPVELREWMELGLVVLPALGGVCSVCGEPSGFICAEQVPGGGACEVRLYCAAHNTEHDPEWHERVEVGQAELVN